MKISCAQCERTSPAQSLFCHDVACPAERSPVVLEAGDRLGDLEILKPITNLRAATVYEALQQEQPVFVKVAHPGQNHRDRLIREATFLRTLRGDKKNLYPTLPRLRAPYTTTTLEQDVVGTIMAGRELLHYYLFDPVEGRPLHELLLQQPQWWINQVGWLCIELATTLNTLHVKGLYHLGLTPASLLVRVDGKSFAPHIVLCDLGIACDAANVGRVWYTDFVPTAYLAPELLRTRDDSANGARAGVGTDVYGIGLVLYEMLIGRPVYDDALASETQIAVAVSHDQRVRMSRAEDVAPVAEVALRATAADMADRPSTAADLAEELIRLVGAVPVKSGRSGPPLNLLLALGGAALVVAFLVTLAISLSAGQP